MFAWLNFGTALKFSFQAPVIFLPPPTEKFGTGIQGRINFCTFHCDPLPFGVDQPWSVKALERHEFSSQAFIPMCGTTGPDNTLALGRFTRSQCVITWFVAFGEPLLTLVDSRSPGYFDIESVHRRLSIPSVPYHPNIWHHPLIALGESQGKMDFACIVNETGVGDIDVEILEWVDPVATVVLPNLVPGRGS